MGKGDGQRGASTEGKSAWEAAKWPPSSPRVRDLTQQATPDIIMEDNNDGAQRDDDSSAERDLDGGVV